MAPSAQSHSRNHSLLLLQKLLNLRDSASPLTLVLDNVEQSAAPLLKEFMGRAKIARSKVIFISFATVRKPRDADTLIKGRGKTLKALKAEIVSHCPPPSATTTKTGPSEKVLLILDTLNPLSSSHSQLLSPFLLGIVGPGVSLVAVYHTDVPLVLPRTVSEYEPHPLTILTHLATTIFRVSSLYQAVEKRRAQNRSLPEPDFGLGEGREGVLIGLRKANYPGVVVEMEMRRRSGRSVCETFVFVSSPTAGPSTGSISLLSDHPLFAIPGGEEVKLTEAEEIELMDATFSLGLTEKQRRDREGVVLPYFDAQTDVGSGEGGRILYELGREDDFDDEEDEI
ncbi:histone acetylation protein 2 [Coniochaeta sp. 2T2.1]|nr:histone acetylation protein 2 [Coniochaeta sp. 2T2.1]